MIGIKNFDMPMSCAHCSMTYEDKDIQNHCCFTYDCVGDFIMNRTKPSNCPLVEIKENE